MASQASEQAALASAMPFNDAKQRAYGYDNAIEPRQGPFQKMPTPTTRAGTLSERSASKKTGAAAREPSGQDGDLQRVRVNSAQQTLTTNQGVAGTTSGSQNGSCMRADPEPMVFSSATSR